MNKIGQSVKNLVYSGIEWRPKSSVSLKNGEEKEIERKKINDKKKEEEFSEKIDELNQETDSLMNEIEKWQI